MHDIDPVIVPTEIIRIDLAKRSRVKSGIERTGGFMHLFFLSRDPSF
jgi:hypothetical protein